jgi:transcriptional regulator with XRE-family HTH domain
MVARREQIREFLKGCRARLDPAKVGLVEPCRRRSPGLRREDVAALAGVSVTWYTWLEQGRDINVSAGVLERICSCLRLTCDERQYLFALVHGRPAPPHSEREEEFTEGLWKTIQFLPVPALVMTLRWDIVAWNCLLAKIFRDYGAIPQENRNLLRIVLTDEEYQRDPIGFEKLARKVLAKFRVDFSQCAGDPSFEALIDELKEIVPDFPRLWRSAEISNCLRGSNIVQHRELGELCFDHSSYVPEGSSFLRVLMFIPRDAKTAAMVASMSREAPTDCVPIAQTRKTPDGIVLRHTDRL